MRNKLFISFFLISIFTYGKYNIPELSNAYLALQENPTSANAQKAYFEAFPSTWMDFYQTYGTPNENLYGQYQEQIAYLGKLNTIKRDAYIDKLTKVVIGGFWDADATSEIRSLIKSEIDKGAAAFFAQLSKKIPAQQMLFWQFYWQSPIKKDSVKKHFEKLKQEAKAKYPKEVSTMGIAYKYFYGQLPMISATK
ncbi:MAG: hypothetical protein RR386_04355 [Bacteroidaceae bacterium]